LPFLDLRTGTNEFRLPLILFFTNGNFVKKIRDFLQENKNIKFKLEVVSLRDSKTAEPIVVEINILKIAS